MSSPIIMQLNQAGIKDIELVGGKNASLGEMLQNLTPLGVRIPQGFIVTVAGYNRFLCFNKLNDRIHELIDNIKTDDIASLQENGAAIRKLICRCPFPAEMIDQISDAYDLLSDQYKQICTDVAVRSSATAEDLPDASFAGQQDTYLNVRGIDQLLDSIKHCFASLFTDRAISYRQGFGYDHFKIGLSVCVQKMVRSDLGSSGVAFSLDTESGFRDAIVINGAFGLGELVVQGTISPDEFIVFKPTLQKGFQSIIEKKLGSKEKKMVYGEEPGERVAIVNTRPQERDHFCLPDHQIMLLSKWVMDIEKYYSTLHKRWCPMDVEWALDGVTKELFIVQARPETIHSRKQRGSFTEYTMKDGDRSSKIVAKGIAVGDKIASGKVRVLQSVHSQAIHTISFNKGDVLVTDMTDPDWEPIMKKAAAIITNKGGRTCHAAIVARELGVPAIVGCGNATELLKEGQVITASCAEGETGIIYDGIIPFDTTTYDESSFPTVDTPVLLNVASPDMAFRFASLPCKGIGLAREEFIINNYIKVHPLALLHHRELGDDKLSASIAEITRGYKDEEEFFVQKLAQGVAKIASAFYPHRVLVRFSDFKSNEYYNLLGGNHFEPEEENPMIGWRGASRYYSPQYREAFLLECRAIKLAREKMGLRNIVTMIPFCRTVTELLQVYDAMKEGGLERGVDGLQVVLMAELPSNIIMARQFAQHIDGFSIGSNDLTQLVLGLDRDSSLVAHIYDERNEAVKSMIEMLIQAAREANISVGICGQGPSDFPDFAQFLVEMGIDSISVTPDSYYKTVKAIHSIEQQLKVLIA
ncbi:phosphoenolpyruvate synthase [Paraflavitalea sp. CAU 1676]|uniref:phosphoenolpyruvate synthase n=1 Tax=Paraflavitalea sp. CAU 1676 TaxID=3032598 RepID=UPI0023DAB7D4|nr:phosphoenolpyruvate synthase [Paraflavitalea sp. CAU 1676]MDF2193277.1 phosphoenolpyruvate synthase [Paraflavitalea sp. CAU 1676]